MLKKCELCSAEQAAPNGLLCIACREAIGRLLVIREDERLGRDESDQVEEIVMYRDGATDGDGKRSWGRGSARERTARGDLQVLLSLPN
jgi:hypothetical protein